MGTWFVDERGREWAVWEANVRNGLADAQPKPAPRPGAADGPRLCFESATERRRLTVYPQWWQSLSPRELALLCQAARPEWPTSVRPPVAKATNTR
jgi:hypothetical protein